MFNLSSARARPHSQSERAEQPRYPSQDLSQPIPSENYMSGHIPTQTSHHFTTSTNHSRDVYQHSNTFSDDGAGPSTRISYGRKEAPPSIATYDMHYHDRRPPQDVHQDVGRVASVADAYRGNGQAYGGHVRGREAGAVLNTQDLTSNRQYTPEPSSATLGTASTHSNEDESWPITSTQDTSKTSVKPKKPRREKPRIELAPDQPPTTQGKPRARVYVACLQCRTRKIRCDGAKPICHNCGRRAGGGLDCNYDAIPKRRGPDKMPGGRQRLARDIKNGMEPPPRRRRRREPAPESAPITVPTQHPDEREDSFRHSSTEILPPELSIGAMPIGISQDLGMGLVPPVAPFAPVMSNYPQPTYSQCECHGLPQCPGVLDPALASLAVPPNALPTVVPSYNDGYGLASVIPPYSDIRGSYISELDEDGNEKEAAARLPPVDAAPSLSFTRKIWWDSLLSLYLSPNTTRLQSLTITQRESASLSITSDLRFLFRASNYWFSFFHIPTFFGNFFDPAKRERIQPSLVLAMLAMSTFWQSSEVGYGEAGRMRALRFRDEAQAAMDASFNAGWIDETLAQTAWLLALFEVCAHPRHTTERSTSSMVMLDSIIRSLSLTMVDADDPATTMFPAGTVPVVNSPKPRAVWLPHTPISSEFTSDPLADAHGHTHPQGCACASLTLQEHWPSTNEHAPMWISTPAWDDQWSEAEIRKESCRRLCWSSMILAAGHISYTTAHRAQGLDLFIADPSNYALLFSGESVARSPMLLHHNSKDTIWALHDRSFLLWHGCIRMRNNRHATDTDKSQFAVKAWLEADGLEDALNRHTCAIERASIFQAREYIFNTRMCISFEFQRYIPLVTANVNGLFHRNKAEEWLTHQATVAERFMKGLHTITGNSNNLLARRPFFVFWFMGQIHRALSLYERDNTLLVALDVCKALIPAIDYLTILWPCAGQRHRYEPIRKKVADALYLAGLDPLPPPNLTLPAASSPESLV